MLFNGVINAHRVDVNLPEGARHIEIEAHVGIAMPVSPTEIGILPAAVLRLPIDRNTAENMIEALTELVDELPKPSDLAIASNLSQVEQEAAKLDKLRDTNGQRD